MQFAIQDIQNFLFILCFCFITHKPFNNYSKNIVYKCGMPWIGAFCHSGILDVYFCVSRATFWTQVQTMIGIMSGVTHKLFFISLYTNTHQASAELMPFVNQDLILNDDGVHFHSVGYNISVWNYVWPSGMQWQVRSFKWYVCIEGRLKLNIFNPLIVHWQYAFTTLWRFLNGNR